MNIIKAHKKFIVGEFAAAMKLMDLNIIGYVNRVIGLLLNKKIEIPLVKWDGWSDPVKVFDEYNDIVEKFNFNMLSKERYHQHTEKTSRL